MLNQYHAKCMHVSKIPLVSKFYTAILYEQISRLYIYKNSAVCLSNCWVMFFARYRNWEIRLWQGLGSVCISGYSDQFILSVWGNIWPLVVNRAPIKVSYQIAWVRRLFWILWVHNITKTCLYHFDPLKPHFYIVKLRFTGYTLFSYFCSKT